MQYKLLQKLFTQSEAGEKVTISKDLFHRLLLSALKSKNIFDEQYYLATNADIRDALKRGQIQSASEHYFTTGYFEGRMPKKILVDEVFYLEHNPDVANAIRKGAIKSAQDHYENAGFHEGRLPSGDFSLI